MSRARRRIERLQRVPIAGLRGYLVARGWALDHTRPECFEQYVIRPAKARPIGVKIPLDPTAPDFVDAIARTLDVLESYEDRSPDDILADIERADRPAPPIDTAPLRELVAGLADTTGVAAGLDALEAALRRDDDAGAHAIARSLLREALRLLLDREASLDDGVDPTILLEVAQRQREHGAILDAIRQAAEADNGGADGRKLRDTLDTLAKVFTLVVEKLRRGEVATPGATLGDARERLGLEYQRYPDFNRHLDDADDWPRFQALEGTFSPSEVLFYLDPTQYEARLDAWLAQQEDEGADDRRQVAG